MSRRLLVGYVTLTLVVLAVLEIPLGVANSRSERRDLSAKVERDAVAVASLAEETLESGGSEAVPALRSVAERYLRDTGGRIVIVNAKGAVLVDSSPPEPGPRSFASRPEIAVALGGDVATGSRHSKTLGGDLLYVAVPVASSGVVHGAVRVSYPTSTLDERVRSYWLLLGAIALVVLALAVAVGVRLSRWVARPLLRLEEAAQAVGGGDLHARAPVDDGPPEVRSLALAFNDTVAKVEALLGSQHEFVADASHQLRTPLTALRLRLENLEADVAEPSRAGLESALAEVERLAQIVEGLLALARADSGEAPAGAVDLAAVVAERVGAWQPLAEERGVALRAEGGPLPPAHAAPERLVQVLDNLIANAVEHSPPRKTVAVRVSAIGERLELRVTDEGPGLSAEERGRAFDRFWRGRTDSAGSGLGLAIVRRLTETDGGEALLEEAPGGGLAAVVRLPRAPA